MKYDINDDIEESIKRKTDISVNMFIQIYSPLSLIGKNVLKWRKYNRIATEKISTNVSRKTNLRFRML
ncbi:hypothetical protein KBB42_00795 [Candidatus Dojkabacteria bacterium]|jgi:hypothetical protein|nr:hypothetical protein [Candidatus Dojkabacteria bacterium]